MSNTATIRAAADVIRANADLLARHGYRDAARVIATIIAISRNYDYNPMASAVRVFADGIHGVATGLDLLNGVTVRGSLRHGMTVTVPVGADTAEANLLYGLAADLYGVAA